MEVMFLNPIATCSAVDDYLPLYRVLQCRENKSNATATFSGLEHLPFGRGTTSLDGCDAETIPAYQNKATPGYLMPRSIAT
jgi:hypothetical protein